MTEFEDYVKRNWGGRWDQTGLTIAALGIGGEAGEVQEHIKKFIRGSKPVDVDALKLELGDVLHYLTVLGQFYGLSLYSIAAANMKKLDERHGRNK